VSRIQSSVTLVPLVEDDFDWLALDREVRKELSTPPGGVETQAVLDILRGIYLKLPTDAGCVSWMIVNNQEVVGLIGLVRPPRSTGEVEIGYGVAESRRRRGFATKGLAALIELLEPQSTISAILAETGVNNPASQKVLASNGFVAEGRRLDPDDGELIIWRRSMSRE
jgi:RimJ/RimL family protein N-acetyltransferase